MFLILLISCLIRIVNGISIDIKEKDLNNSIEKVVLINNNLFVGTINSLHRLSSETLNPNLLSLKLGPQFDSSSQQTDYHFKLLFSIKNENLFFCGTLYQGLCQIIDQDFNLIINSSLPIVANDPINSTIGLYIPEKNLIYFGVTYTNEGVYRWQIPNIAGRSLDLSNFMKILSVNNDDQLISRDDLSLRFMPRQQTTFIVQYIYSFYTKNYIYFLTNQPNDIDQTNYITKITRFCRHSSTSIIRSYTEMPLVCSNSEWILKSAQTIIDKNNNQMILIGLFIKRDGSIGTNICSWNIHYLIDKAFQDNYQNCYSMGIGQRGLAFIKPNEPCRKDESWSIGINEDDLCPWIISDRLPYPVGGIIPIVGRLLYENLLESSSTIQLHSFGSSILLLQGLINGTFKLGILDLVSNIKWIYSYQLSTQLPIISDILFDNHTATFFLASGTKIYRLSFSVDCASRSSCDECFSSSTNPFCGWCTINERCTLSSDCPLNCWQQANNQCTRIVNVQPLNASIDYSQWINLTLSKLPQLEHNEIYQCIFADKTMSLSTQAIKLDHNRLSCPTPSNHLTHQNIHRQIANELKVTLSVIKWPSNTSIASISEFTFYNCSSYSSCQSCGSKKGCHWCSERCSSMCTETSSSSCSSFNLIDPSNIFIPSGQPIEIPLKFDNIIESPIECRLNETIVGVINQNNICHISKIPEIKSENDQMINLFVYQNNISIGFPIKMFIYECNLYDSCDVCQSRFKCSWCQGECLAKKEKKCLTNDQCTSLRIQDFSPKLLPLEGETVVSIDLNELMGNKIDEITLADIPCLIIKSSNRKIECLSNQSESSRQGQIKIYLTNSIIIYSKEFIQYRQSSILSFNPMIIYEFGGQILHIKGNHLITGNQQEIFISNFQCIKIQQTLTNSLSCRLPFLPSGFYNITILIDKTTILKSENILKVTPNPVVQDINPIITFASGGRLVTIRGMYFGSAQSIIAQFSHQKWNAKLNINPNDITSSNDGIISSFTFRTPTLPAPSNEFHSPPIDIDFSLYFDQSISLLNLIQFHYIPDVLLNISSIPPTLSYTGEELKLQVQNLTEAASMDDIQLLIGCSQCQLKTFTSKGITCQPPTQLAINTPLILNNQQHQVDCTIYNSSIGPIRFRIGFREYLIGYLSYIRPSSPRYSVATIIYLSLASCLLIIALLTCALCLFIKVKNSKEKSSSLSPIRNNEENEKVFWSTTTTSAAAGPYYQVYEQIPSSSSHQNTLTRAPLLVCPYHHHHYKQEYSTLSLMRPLQTNLPFLTTLSIEHDQFKKLLFTSDTKHNPSSYRRQSMELFYDLLGMTPFSEAFIDHLIINNGEDLFKCYAYIFRYNPLNLKSFPLTREISLLKLICTFFFQSKTNLNEFFNLFDNLINSLIDFIDCSPSDQLLHRSFNSLSSSTLLLLLSNLEYNNLELSLNYENLLRFNIRVFDCDTIDQIKDKLIHYLNSYEKTFRLIEYDQLDLGLSLLNHCLCTQQIPMLKQYSINSTISCRKKSSWKNIDEKEKSFLYHLCQEDQLINDQYLINEKLKENKIRFDKVLKNFYQEILKGFKLFSSWEKEIDKKYLFKEYIQVITDLIRRLNILMISRSTSTIIQSCLNVIAEGLEFIFQTKTQFSSEIEFLFADDKKHFASFDKSSFNIPSSSFIESSSLDIRSLILNDDTAIEGLFKLYQFYELYSESINQHIGENHVSVLLPVHHLLVQIRQLINSDVIRSNTTII